MASSTARRNPNAIPYEPGELDFDGPEDFDRIMATLEKCAQKQEKKKQEKAQS